MSIVVFYFWGVLFGVDDFSPSGTAAVLTSFLFFVSNRRNKNATFPSNIDEKKEM